MNKKRKSVSFYQLIYRAIESNPDDFLFVGSHEINIKDKDFVDSINPTPRKLSERS